MHWAGGGPGDQRAGSPVTKPRVWLAPREGAPHPEQLPGPADTAVALPQPVEPTAHMATGAQLLPERKLDKVSHVVPKTQLRRVLRGGCQGRKGEPGPGEHLVQTAFCRRASTRPFGASWVLLRVDHPRFSGNMSETWFIHTLRFSMVVGVSPLAAPLPGLCRG